MSNMLTHKQITKKLINILSIENPNHKIQYTDIAAALNINYNTFKQQLKRGAPIPYLEIMQFLAARKISINYFFFDQLPESLINATDNIIMIKYNKNINASAGGGALNHELFHEQVNIDRVLLDYIGSDYQYTELINTLGDSMEPLIPDGSLVFIDRSKVELIPGQIYVVNIAGEIFMKKLFLTKGRVICQSINSEYSNVVLTLDEVNIVGIIRGVLNKI